MLHFPPNYKDYKFPTPKGILGFWCYLATNENPDGPKRLKFPKFSYIVGPRTKNPVPNHHRRRIRLSSDLCHHRVFVFPVGYGDEISRRFAREREDWAAGEAVGMVTGEVGQKRVMVHAWMMIGDLGVLGRKINNEGIVVFCHANFEEKVCFLWHTRESGACNTNTVNFNGKSDCGTLVQIIRRQIGHWKISRRSSAKQANFRVVIRTLPTKIFRD